MLVDFFAMRVTHLNFNPGSYCRGWPFALWGSEDLEIDTYYLLIKMNALKRAETHSGRFLFIRIPVSLCFCLYMIYLTAVSITYTCLLSVFFQIDFPGHLRVAGYWSGRKMVIIKRIVLAVRSEPSKKADIRKIVSAHQPNSKWTCQVSCQP